MDTKALEAEIARLQGLKESLSTQSIAIQSPTNDLRETVRQILREELAAAVPPEQQKIPLLAAVGTGLSEEQQIWLAQSSNQDRLSEFFMTPEGQAVTRRFFTLYKEFTCK
jgi:hypothetical protein